RAALLLHYAVAAPSRRRHRCHIIGTESQPMTDRIATLAERLREKGAATAAFFRALEPHDWSVTVYTEGSAWDARQVLCHFVSAEESLLRLFRNVAAGGEGVPEDFGLDGFNESEVSRMDGLAPADLIARFEAARAEMVAFVEGLEGADLDRVRSEGRRGGEARS